jgi:hypothetical protein
VDAHLHAPEIARQQVGGAALHDVVAGGGVLVHRRAVLGHVGDDHQAAFAHVGTEVARFGHGVQRLGDGRCGGGVHLGQAVQIGVQSVSHDPAEALLHQIGVGDGGVDLAAPSHAAAAELARGRVRISVQGAHRQLVARRQPLVLQQDQRLGVVDLARAQAVGLVHQHDRVRLGRQPAGDAAGLGVKLGRAVHEGVGAGREHRRQAGHQDDDRAAVLPPALVGGEGRRGSARPADRLQTLPAPRGGAQAFAASLSPSSGVGRASESLTP